MMDSFQNARRPPQSFYFDDPSIRHPYHDAEDDSQTVEEFHVDVDGDASIPDDVTRNPRHNLRSASPLWRRLIPRIFPFASSASFPTQKETTESAIPFLPLGSSPRKPQRSISRCLLYSIGGFFIMLGVIQFISIAFAICVSFFPDELDRASENWKHSHQNLDPADAVSHWPTDISRDIIPIGCHSHNDYWRRVPLFSALQAGCVSVEADVWLFDDDLFVGHTTSALTPKRTLRSMYIEPLLRILDKQNPTTQFNKPSGSQLAGVFDTDPAQTLVLLIDFKTDGPATWSQVVAQLSPLRERGYLTHFNGQEVIPGPITVVGTGNTPFDLVTSVSTYRDVFFDAPLNKLIRNNTQAEDGNQHTSEKLAVKPSAKMNRGQGLSGTSDGMMLDPNTFNATNSYYASVSFRKSIGVPWRFYLTNQQMDLIKDQVQAAHSHGLKVRYWGIPSWPRNLRNHLWTVLAREGVDILNVDDLESAARKDWIPKVLDWW